MSKFQKKKAKESSRKRLLKPGVLFMLALWFLLMITVVGTLYFSYKKKDRDGNNLEKHIKAGYSYLKNGDFDSLNKAIEQFKKASKIKQRDMRIWAGLSLSEVHLVFYHNLRRKMWSKYRNVGVTLISDHGAGVFDNGSEPFWLESNLLQEYSFGKLEKDITRALFRSRRDWGYHKAHCGLKRAVANGYLGLGMWERALKSLDKCSSIRCDYMRGMIYLESGNKKKAAGEFKKILRNNPNHNLSKLGLIHSSLKPPTPAERVVLTKLSSHQSPNIARWSQFLAARGKTGVVFNKKSPKSNIPLLLIEIIEYYIQKGELDTALKFYGSLLVLRSGNASRVRLIDGLILFTSGEPGKAWNHIKSISPKARLHYGVMFLWFSGKYQDAAKEASNLSENHPWRMLTRGKNIKSDDPVLNLAKLWKYRGEQKLLRNRLALLTRTNEASFYFRFLEAKIDLEAAHHKGHGTIDAEKLVLHAISQIDDRVEESLIGKRLKALAYHMIGQDLKALQLMEKICLTGLSKKADPGVCSSPYANIEDRRFLLEILLFPDGPEKDLEIVISKAMKLIPIVAKTRGDMILWKARLALVQIRVLPGSTERLAKSVLDMVEEGKTYSPAILNSLAPIYALLGKHQRAVEIWRTSHKNEVVHSIQLSLFLSEIGYVKESLEISGEILKRKDLSLKSTKSALLSMGKAMDFAKKDSTSVFQRLFKLEKTNRNAILLGRSLLTIYPGLKKEVRVERCQLAVKLFSSYAPRAPGKILSLMRSITRCTEVKKSVLLKLLQKIPKNHILRREGEKLSR